MTTSTPTVSAKKFADALFENLTRKLPGLNENTFKEAFFETESKGFKVTELVAPPNGTLQSWTVHAVYSDNNQQWTDTVEARTGLEAAVFASMERRTDFGDNIIVSYVENADGVMGYDPSIVGRLVHRDNLRDFDLLCEVLQRRNLVPLEVKALDWLSSAVANTHQSNKQLTAAGLGELNQWQNLSDFDELNGLLKNRASVPAVVDNTYQVPTQAILALCEAAERSFGGVLEMEQIDAMDETIKSLYRIRALVEYFGIVVDEAFDFEPIGLTLCSA